MNFFFLLISFLTNVQPPYTRFLSPPQRSAHQTRLHALCFSHLISVSLISNVLFEQSSALSSSSALIPLSLCPPLPPLALLRFDSRLFSICCTTIDGEMEFRIFYQKKKKKSSGSLSIKPTCFSLASLPLLHLRALHWLTPSPSFPRCAIASERRRSTAPLAGHVCTIYNLP